MCDDPLLLEFSFRHRQLDCGCCCSRVGCLDLKL
ncbi:hypothetical protein V6Z12_A10G150500 [Gossypium hirsutum]